MRSKPKLGQHFLIDDAARHAIADALGDVSARTVIEIGPGHGAITSILAARCRRLIAVEVDPVLAAELRFRFREQKNVAILESDILASDLAGLTADGEDSRETVDVVGNLPYYITSEILLRLFAAARNGLLGRAVLMMQLEVADRLAAVPGTREYGLLSGTTQMHARAETLFTLAPNAFSPPPDVFSSVLRLEFAPRFAELGVEPSAFDVFLRSCFAQKRKTLGNNLRAAGRNGGGAWTAETLRAVWPADIPAQARAESLTLEQLAELHRALRSTKN